MATSAHPVRCSYCHGLSYVSGWAHALFSLLLEVALWGSIIAALSLHSWYALLLFPLGVFASMSLFNFGFQLRPTNASAAAKANVFSLVTMACFVVAFLVAYFVSGSR